MRIEIATIKERQTYQENRSYGILNYDAGNRYPQDVSRIISNSGIATSCVDLLKRYIVGNGLVNDIEVNENEYLNDVFRLTAKDFAQYGGFAVHINYNAQYKVITIKHVDFSYCRLAIDKDGNFTNQIAVYDDWDKKKRKIIRHADIKFINRFNPDKVKDEVRRQTWDGYLGQIYWYSDAGFNTYPFSPADPVLEDIQTHGEIKTFKNQHITHGFMASHYFVMKGKFEDDQKRAEFVDKLKTFQGAGNSNRIMLFEVDTEEEVPQVKAFENVNNDNLFEYTEKSIKDNIIENYAQPKILLGIETAGKLGMSNMIKDAMTFYNQQTRDYRTAITDIYNKILAASIFNIVFEIDEFSVTEEEKEATNETN